MSNETPRVVDKRRFADDGSTKVHAMGDDRRLRGTVWNLRPDGDYENKETGDVVPHGMFPEPAEGQDSWRVSGYEPATAQFSPSSEPKHVPGMDFGTALKQVIRGQRVTRLEWGNPEIWLMMFYWGAINPKTQAGKYLTIHHADGTMNPLYASDGDIMAEDWVVVV